VTCGLGAWRIVRRRGELLALADVLEALARKIRELLGA